MEQYIDKVIGIDDLVNLIISYIPGCYICGDTRNIIKLTTDSYMHKIESDKITSLIEIKNTEDGSCELLKRFIIPGVKSQSMICPFHFNERYNNHYYKCAFCNNIGTFVSIDDNQLVCEEHIINKRIIDNTKMFLCQKNFCCHRSSYLNLTTMNNHCSIHKGDNYVLNVLDYREDIKSSITCYNCERQVEHYYTCTCGIIRCPLCMFTYSYLVNNKLSCVSCNTGHPTKKLYFSNYFRFGKAPTCKNTPKLNCKTYINYKTNNLVCDCTQYYTKDIEYGYLMCVVENCNVRCLSVNSEYCEYHSTYKSYLKRKILSFFSKN